MIYLCDGIIDLVDVEFAYSAYSVPVRGPVPFLINHIFLVVSTGLAHKLEASLAFMNSIKLQEVKSKMAELTLISLVALVDPLVY